MPETILIFDLDDCLFETTYYLNTFGNSFYNSITFNDKLYNILSSIPNKKIVFTNANHNHATKILNKLGIIHLFHKILSRDNIGHLKPSPHSFSKVNNYIRNYLKMSQYNVIFFEDNKNNLLQSKNYNWYTVLINKDRETTSNSHIDFKFYNIIDALFFISCNILN